MVCAWWYAELGGVRPKSSLLGQVVSGYRAVRCHTDGCICVCACNNTQRTTALAGAWVLKCLSKMAVFFSSSPGPCRSERAERARYRSSTRLCVCVSVSNRALGIGIGSALQSWIAQLAELHTVSHSA